MSNYLVPAPLKLRPNGTLQIYCYYIIIIRYVIIMGPLVFVITTLLIFDVSQLLLS